MAQKYYLAAHEEQRGTGQYATTNCAAASGAMLVDQATLGIRNPGVGYFRKLTDDTEGGLQMGQVASVLEEDFGLEVRLYDYDDNLKWSRLVRYLNHGCFAVVAGDYDVLPPKLQGADYDGFHAVMYHQRFVKNQRVGDPLLKRWVKWPNELAYKYVMKFDRQVDGGIHAAIMIPQYAKLRSGVLKAAIRAEPSKGSEAIATMTSVQKIVTGGTVKGEVIAGVKLWRKVWVSSTASFGYIHWTQTWQD